MPEPAVVAPFADGWVTPGWEALTILSDWCTCAAYDITFLGERLDITGPCAARQTTKGPMF
jgi:hypothetical protein